jgi:hypothetical protein
MGSCRCRRACCGFRFTKNGGAFLAAYFDGLSAYPDGDAGVIQFAIAHGAGIVLHLISPVFGFDTLRKHPSGILRCQNL